MNALASSNGDDLVHGFIRSTRDVAKLLANPDFAQLTHAMQRQLEAFEALKSTITAGTLRDPSILADAIDEGQRTLLEAQRRMNEIRDDLGNLRTARARTSRRRAADATAHFVSQRV